MELQVINDNPQVQSLTTALKNICRDYPAGGGVIRELLQNADDAGAHVARFVLDCGTYPAENLFHDGLSQFHGPALLAFNSAQFTDADFMNVARIGKSHKIDDGSTTGRFGRGFNSVYNWTDSPSVISRHKLWISDPHRWCSNTGGPTYDFVANAQRPEMRNYLKAFGAVLKCLDRPFDGTIIRIPLRTQAQAAKSDISNRIANVSELSKVLQDFATEFGDNGLLFMRNIEKLEFEYDSTSFGIEMLECKTIRKHKLQINTAIKHALKDPQYLFDHSFEATMKYTFHGGFKESSFVVHHSINGGVVDSDVRKWSQEEKLIPWVAIAARVPSSEAIKQGSLFSVLPLPIGTTQPVHIHGLFAISSDRARLYQLNDKGNQDQQQPRWNELLLTEVVPAAWTKLLCYLARLSPRGNSFARWPRTVDNERDLLSRAVVKVLNIIKNEDLPLWPTHVGYKSAQAGLLATASVSSGLKTALEESQVPVVYISHQSLLEYAKEIFQDRVLTPRSLSSFLKAKSDQVKLLSSEAKLQILTYMLSQTGFTGYDGLEIFPFKDNSFRALGQDAVFIHRDPLEDELFALNGSRTIDIEKFSQGTKKIFARNCDAREVHASIQYHSVASLQEYSLSVVFKNISGDSDMVTLDEGQASFASKARSWIIQYGINIHDVSNLWLLPLSNKQYRKVQPRNPVSQIYLAPTGAVGKLMLKFDNKISVKSLPLLDVGPLGLNSDFVSTLLTGSKTNSHLAINDASKISVFLAWLQKTSAIDDGVEDEDRHLVAKIVSSRIPRPLNQTEVSSMRSSLAELKIFQKVSWTEDGNEMKPVLKWTNLGSCTKSIGLVDGICPVPNIPNTQFVFAEWTSPAKQILETLQMVPCVQAVRVIQEHIIPAWLRGDAGSWTDLCKEQISSFVLDHFAKLNSTNQIKLQALPIVPVMQLNSKETSRFATASELIDPSVLELTELYFDNEEILAKTDFFSKFKFPLRECGLKTAVDEAVVENRVRCYASSRYSVSEVRVCAEKLLKSSCRWNSTPNQWNGSDLRHLKWLPAIDTDKNLLLAAADGCRSSRDELLVSSQLPLLPVPVSTDWEARLGWGGTLPFQVLLSQLKFGVAGKDRKIVDAVLTYIDQKTLTDSLVKNLKSLPCVLANNGHFIKPSVAFSPEAKAGRSCEALFPYCANVDQKFWTDHGALLQRLGIKELELDNLLGVQAELEKMQVLAESDIDVAVALVNVASYYPRSSLATLKVISDAGELVPIQDINYYDLGGLRPKEKVNLTHPQIRCATVSRLKIVGLRDRMINGLLDVEDGDEEDEFDQQESVSTRIADTLDRYPIKTTFKEYLANADDAKGASKISWLFDEREHTLNRLLTPGLMNFQGPALLVHNDAVFTSDDFKGFKNVGEGSKSEDKATIGQFGRGSQTMYHWTDVPMILSGKYLLILDPQREYLQRNQINGKHKSGIKVELSRLRGTFSGQLSPFEGLWGYTQELDHYAGTIFRFPLRNAKQRKSLMGKNRKILTKPEIQKLMDAYFYEARISLLFLRRVQSIDFSIYGESTKWSVTRSTTANEDGNSFSELVTCSLYMRHHDGAEIKDQEKWWVAIEDLRPDVRLLPFTGRRLMKNVECGIAAFIPKRPSLNDPKPHSLFPEAIKSRLFNTLPLPLTSDLPVHVHATFILSGDRGSIATDGEDARGSKWNRYLLQDALPELYLEFLDAIGPKALQDVFGYWPQSTPPKGSVAEIISEAFWKKLPGSSLRLFPKALPIQEGVQRRAPKIFDINQAIFDFLPWQTLDALIPLLLSMGENVVRNVPAGVAINLKKIPNVKCISGPMLRKLFKSDKGRTFLEQEVNNAPVWSALLPLIVPTDVEELQDLGGCHILPLMDGSLATLKLLNSDEDQLFPYLMPKNKDIEVFSFGSRHFVSANVTTALDSILKSGKFNLESLNLGHVNKLLKLRAPIISSPNPEVDKWLEEFWAFWKLNDTAADVRSVNIKDVDAKLFRAIQTIPNVKGLVASYATPKEFYELPAVVEPSLSLHRQLCQSIPGLYIFDRKLMPNSFRDEEGSLSNSSSFYRFVRALRLLAGNAGIASFVQAQLDPSLIKALQQLVVSHVSDYNILGENSALFPGLEEDLKSLPLWYSFVTSDLMGAKDVLIAADSSLLVPWMTDKGRFIDTGLVNPRNEQCLLSLGARKVPRDSLLSEYIFPLPSTLDVDGWSHLRRLLGVIANIFATSGLSQLVISTLSQRKLAFDTNANLRKASELYDDTDQIFLAAFRYQDGIKFLDKDLRKHRPFWLRIGLRHRTPAGQFTNSGHYIQCLVAIQLRLNSANRNGDLHLEKDTQTVLAPLITTTPMSRGFNEQDWIEIANAKIFRPQGNMLGESQYRQTRMQHVATGQRALSLSEIIVYDHAAVCWSQTPFPAHRPTSEVMANVPGNGRPKVAMVWLHLQYLQSVAQSIQRHHLYDFLKDLKLTYKYLQDSMIDSQMNFRLTNLKVWLNVDSFDYTTILLDDVKSSWYSVEQLVLSSSCDAGPIKAVKQGLMQFDKLLRALGCSSITYPIVSRPQVQTGYCVSSSIRQLRKDGQMADISYASEGKEIHAHRLVLAAASPMCAAQFSGRWPLENPIRYDKTQDAEGFLSFHTLSTMIDFAYQEEINWKSMEVTESDGIEKRAEKLELLLGICKGADCWLMPELKSQAEGKILDAGKLFINLDNVPAILKRAEEAGAKELSRICVLFIDQNQDAVNKAHSATAN